MGSIHQIQKKLLDLGKIRQLSGKTLREIGGLVGAPDAPQIVKHHLTRLQERGLITADFPNREYLLVNLQKSSKDFISVPIFGAANCGSASIIANDQVEGYLKVSKRIIGQRKIFAIRAVGNSMNRANLKGSSIENGDLVLVDRTEKTLRDNDYVVGVIDGCATIKKVRLDKKNQTMTLMPESTESFTPIILHSDDNLFIAGKVVQVVKTV